MPSISQEKIFQYSLLLPLLVVLCALTLLPNDSYSAARGTLQESIKQIDSLFQYGEIDHAETEALKLLSDRHLTDDDRVHLECLIGSIYVARSDSLGAKQAFQRALRLRPNLTLNPNTTAPKIIALFEVAKLENSPSYYMTDEQIELYEVAKIRLKAYPVGYVLPGWGILRQGKSREGTILLTSECALLAGTIYAAISANKAHDDYHAAGSDNAAARWDTYKSWVQKRDLLLISTAVLHTVGILDITYGRLALPGKTQLSINGSGVGIALTF